MYIGIDRDSGEPAYMQIYRELRGRIIAGAFVQGSSIELSADGPLREPYAVYLQGGLTWPSAKFGILYSLQKLYEANLVSRDSLC